MYELIKKYEGFSPVAYKCPAGVWTIGYGSTTYLDGSKVKKGDEITKAQAEKLMENFVYKEIRPKIKDLKLTDRQAEAVISLIYNVGWAAFSRSKCYKAMKKKDWDTVFHNWDWIKSNGKVLPGLVKRRAEEMDIFFSEI